MIIVFDLVAGSHVYSKPNYVLQGICFCFVRGTRKLTFLRECVYMYFYGTPPLPFTMELKDLKVEGFLRT